MAATAAQLVLFESPAEVAFWAFHSEHPEVYRELVRLAREAKAAGFRRYSIKTLWERMRWHFSIERGDRDFKLNNNYHSRYARLIMEQEPDLAGFFEVRELKS